MPQRFPSQRPIAENRCAAFFVSPVAPDSETRIAAAWNSAVSRKKKESICPTVFGRNYLMGMF
jgi:hypothetical protein